MKLESPRGIVIRNGQYIDDGPTCQDCSSHRKSRPAASHKSGVVRGKQSASRSSHQHVGRSVRFYGASTNPWWTSMRGESRAILATPCSSRGWERRAGPGSSSMDIIERSRRFDSSAPAHDCYRG
jgi:hypothetical protein